MPSVVAAWSGQCVSPELQRELLVFIEDLAKLSHSLFDEPPLGTDEPVKVPEIRHWDSRIRGKIVVSRGLMDETSAEKYGVEVVETQQKPDIAKVIFGEVTADTIESVKWPLLHEIYLNGIEFCLYDPSGGWDRMSFVFVSHECPELNGQLVLVEDHAECQCYESEAIKQADWFLTRPSVHLRYYLEHWFDYIMGWIRYFFIPDLHYWRWDDLSGYDDLRAKLDMLLIEVRDGRALRQAVFEDVIERFEYEAVEWWNAMYGVEHNKKRVPRLRKIEDRNEGVKGKTELHPAQRTGGSKLDAELKKIAEEYRERGIPVTDDLRIDMDAFKGVVYPAEEVERDKAAVRRLEQIRYEDATDVENIRRKLGKCEGG